MLAIPQPSQFTKKRSVHPLLFILILPIFLVSFYYLSVLLLEFYEMFTSKMGILFIVFIAPLVMALVTFVAWVWVIYLIGLWFKTLVIAVRQMKELNITLLQSIKKTSYHFSEFAIKFYVVLFFILTIYYSETLQALLTYIGKLL